MRHPRTSLAAVAATSTAVVLGLAAPGLATTRTVTPPTVTVCVTLGGVVSVPASGTGCLGAGVATQVPAVLAPEVTAGVSAGAIHADAAVDLRVVRGVVGATLTKVTTAVDRGVTLTAGCTTTGPKRPVRVDLTLTPPVATRALGLARATTAHALSVDGRVQVAGIRLATVDASVGTPLTLSLEAAKASAGAQQGEVNVALPGVAGVLGVRTALTADPATGACSVTARVVPSV